MKLVNESLNSKNNTELNSKQLLCIKKPCTTKNILQRIGPDLHVSVAQIMPIQTSYDTGINYCRYDPYFSLYKTK